jgi:hypothetical protein
MANPVCWLKLLREITRAEPLGFSTLVAKR